MYNHPERKKARRVAAIFYLLLMAFVMTGTYLSEQRKAAIKEADVNSPIGK